MNIKLSSMTRLIAGISAGVVLGLLVGGQPALAAGGGQEVKIERQEWSFGGFFGKYDKAQLQRGFGVYLEVCSACHGLKLLAYRNLMEKGGPEFSKAQALAIAKEATVVDGFTDDGEPKERPGKLSDRFVPPYKNDAAARAANNGALPPDLSVIVKARTYHRHVPWYSEPYYWAYDMATAYEEKGADYLYALLTSYKTAPRGMKMNQGMHYNEVFSGQQIAMAKPLSAEIVEYADGTKPTLEQHSADVVAFLAWASEPHLNARKDLGKRVMVYLAILALLLFLAKRSVWARAKH